MRPVWSALVHVQALSRMWLWAGGSHLAAHMELMWGRDGMK